MTKARTLADNFAADINGITAGTGITGGGTSGTVTVTNSMATAIDAKGDLVVGTGADTFSRLAVASTAGYLLSVDSAESTGLKWAAPAAASFVGCRLKRSGTFNVSNNTFTAVPFNLEDFDTDAFHDTSTNNSRITIPAGKAGKYLLIGNFLWGTDPTGRRELLMYKNGSVLPGVIVMQATSSEGAGLCLSMIQDLAVSDYVELYVKQTSGQTIDSNASNTIFQAQYLGA